MTIEQTKSEIIFRIQRNTDIDDLQDLVDYFLYRSVTRKAKATLKQIDDLVKEVKKGRWDKTREKLGLVSELFC
ncbi:MAG: hypothetical protein IPI46_04230 [Bacteroidetes bacterium]|nr:hypothetical protein [Bacteroidota bacterium]